MGVWHKRIAIPKRVATSEKPPVTEIQPGLTFSSPGTTTTITSAAAKASPPSPSAVASVALKKCSPLLTAILSSNLDMARLLVGAGAKLEVRSGPAGLTPLHRVVDGGNVDATLALLDLGADLFTADLRQRGLLHTAVTAATRVW
ncbi:hypothetical protein PgNI_11117 [Pyricularia grisea]|uniref:Uncharacterized protein n=1 Tax=Pyricularia grisea TaxID=148305 RepID=A0A6P8AXA3_PYRGI|nr:hypothetical protein PgNI_11117 [Pyricularia grisea]TLD06968.1 hypothetical protein PgNI_11117 [Pyricularia grisea]